MKHLKTYNESKLYINEIILDIKDILLEIEDIGYKSNVMAIERRSKILIEISRPDRRIDAGIQIIDNPSFRYSEVSEVVLRISDYCSQFELSKFYIEYLTEYRHERIRGKTWVDTSLTNIARYPDIEIFGLNIIISK